MKRLIRTIFICQIILSSTSCYYDVQEDLHPESASLNCDTTQALYSAHINNIMVANCNSCHSTPIASGGVITDTYTEVKKIADNGRLQGAVNHEAGFRPMPQNLPKLAGCQLALINKWIREGALDN